MADTRFKKGHSPWNKKEPIKKTCKCGKEFFVRPSLERIKSCSRKCGHSEKVSGFKGRRHTNEAKQKMSLAKSGIRGKDHWNWRGGKGTTRHILMQQIEYKQWRKEVFERDNYTCQICQARGIKLNADHILPWSKYPKQRYEISNGRTLCFRCHYTVTFNKDFPKHISTWG